MECGVFRVCFVIHVHVADADPVDAVDDVDCCDEVDDDDEVFDVDGNGAVTDPRPFGRIIIVAFFNV